ncbi:MAG: phage tail protein [Actinomycetota bacterium]
MDDRHLSVEGDNLRTSRRRFILGAAGLTGVAAAGGGTWVSPVLAAPAPAAPAPAAPVQPGGFLLLQLEGEQPRAVMEADGGDAVGIVASEPSSTTPYARKHLDGVKYEDITITCGTGMSKAFYDWIAASFTTNDQRRSGSVVAADFNYKERSTRDFKEALITEVGMPALDAASKDAAKMTIKFSPESTRNTKGSGAVVRPPVSKAQKKWLPANFRLTIAGLESACAKVSKVEALTIKQSVASDPAGDQLDNRKEPGKIDFPNLKVTLPEAWAEPFFAWHGDFVVKGNSGDEKEKSGTLEYLTPDLSTALFTLSFKGLGIFKCAPEKAEAGSENIRRVKAEMYCEQITFKYGDAVWS